MSYNEFLYTDFTGFAGQRDTFFGGRVPGSENDVCFSTYFHYPHDFRQDMPIVIQHGNTLFFSMMPDILVNSILCRHPDAAAKITCCIHCLFRSERVHFFSMYPIHAKASEHLEIRQYLTN